MDDTVHNTIEEEINGIVQNILDDYKHDTNADTKTEDHEDAFWHYMI